MPRLASLTAFLLLGAGALAQNAPSSIPSPGAATVQLQFPNVEVSSILEVYERLTGKRIIRDQGVMGQLYIFVNDPVPTDEAIRIIEISLLMNGFSLVPTPDGKIVKVLGLGKNPRTAAVPIYSDEDLIPENEQVVTFLYKLRYADPTELAQTLSQAFPPSPVVQGSPNMVALPKAGALLITENTAIIRSIVKIVRAIDWPPAEVIEKFITLERADAKDVLEKLTAIFEKKDASGSPGGVPVPRAVAVRPATTPEGIPIPADATVQTISPNSVEISGGSLSEDSLIVGQIKMTADTRTNRIHVVTREENMRFVEHLIEEFDSDVKFGEPSVRTLRFVSAADVLEAVVTAITDPGAKVDDTGGAGGGGGTRGRTGAGGGQNQDLQSNRGGGNSGNGGNFGGGNGGGFSLSESLSTEERPIVPMVKIVGNTKIIADTRANAIIVLGNNSVKEKVFRTLDLLDRRQPQVMMHTIIGELTLGSREEFGVNYILRNGGRTAGSSIVGPGTPANPPPGGPDGQPGTNGNGVVSFVGGRPSLNLNNLLSQRNITQIAAGGAGGLSGFVTLGDSLTAVVNALESTNRFRVTSRPMIFASNNKKATIASGQEIAVPANIQSGFNSGNNIVTNSSIQYKTVALQLEVIPLINSDREVTLDIVQKVDEVSGSTRIDDNDIPTISTRVLKTTVSVPNEGTLVLGGLIRQADTRSAGGIPYLSRIPLLGYLFKNTVKDKARTELVVLIRPVVTTGPAEAIGVRERNQEFLNMEPDIESGLAPSATRKKVPGETLIRTPALKLRDTEITVTPK